MDRFRLANKKHDVCLQKSDSLVRTFEIISSSPEAIDDWIQGLHKHVKGRIAIAVELEKGPITLQSLFQQHLSDYEQSHQLDANRLKVCDHLLRCHTPELGGLSYECDHCEQEIPFH